MNRRHFLEQTSKAALVSPFLKLPSFLKDVPMGLVVHSYAHRWNLKEESKNYPGFSNALQLIEHSHAIGAGGVQVGVRGWTADFVKTVRSRREKLGLYLEGSIGLPKDGKGKHVFEEEVKAAKEAGAEVLRTVCLGGRRYETFHSPEAFDEFRKSSLAWLQLAEPVVRKYKMKLAVENHKDWRAPELVKILRQLDSEWVGTTVDFGNSIALLEDPMEVVNALAPFAFSTHVKDMGVDEYDEGFLLSEVPLGEGFLDLPRIVSTCKKFNPGVRFNLEMITRDPLKIPCLTDGYWSTFGEVGPQELARALRMVRGNASKGALPEVSHLGIEERLAAEERNIIASLQYSKGNLEQAIR